MVKAVCYLVFWHIKIEDGVAIQDKLRITPLSRFHGVSAPETASLRNLTPFDGEDLLAVPAFLKKIFDKIASIKYI